MPNDAGLAIACSRYVATHFSVLSTQKNPFSPMETAISHQREIERLETEKRQLEDRIRQLKHATQNAERKRLTRAKIILGSLALRNHVELLLQLKAEASPQDGELLRSVFPQAAKQDSPSSRHFASWLGLCPDNRISRGQNPLFQNPQRALSVRQCLAHGRDHFLSQPLCAG
jgi:hypothetical protein